jgi:hypothetical protein
MMAKSITPLPLLLLCIIFMTFCSEKQNEKEAQQLNILFIAVDDLRPELGFMVKIISNHPTSINWQVKVLYSIGLIAMYRFAVLHGPACLQVPGLHVTGTLISKLRRIRTILMQCLCP